MGGVDAGRVRAAYGRGFVIFITYNVGGREGTRAIEHAKDKCTNYHIPAYHS